MLDGVGNKFIHDERERDCYVSAYNEPIGVDCERPGHFGIARRRCKLLAKVGKVPVQLNCSNVIKFVELLMNGSHGRDTGCCAPELLSCRTCCLQIQKAR